MRVTLKIDSATADEARDFIVAYQLTRDRTLAVGLHQKPTVDIMGQGWGVTTPAIEHEQAAQVMHHFTERRDAS